MLKLLSFPVLFGMFFEGETENSEAVTDLEDEYFGILWGYPKPTGHGSSSLSSSYSACVL
jgi:hypothetical protein